MKSMKKLLLSFLAVLTVFFTVLPSPAYAQFRDWGGCTETVTDASGNTAQIATLKCLPVVFGNLIYAALIFVGTVSAFLIIYAGIQFVTSGGDQKKVGQARQIITYALIGLVLVLSSFAIISVISYTTGTECIREFGFDNCK
jgi:hypothetical protein